MKIRVSLFLVALMMPAMSLATADRKFYKTIELRDQQLQQESLAVVALDGDIYDASQDNYADLRLLDDSGKEVPYVLIAYSELRQQGLAIHLPHSDAPYHEYKLSHQLETRDKETVIRVITRREPIRALVISIAECNYRRQARVELGESKAQIIGRGEISCLELRGVRQEATVLDFPEQRRSEYRVVIENRDSPPLKVSGVRGLGNVHCVLWLASPSRRYRLYYGGRAERPPEYDTFAIQEACRLKMQPVVALLGEQHANPDFVERPEPVKRWHERFGEWFQHPQFWLAVLAALACILGLVWLRAMRRITNQTPPQP